MDRQTVALGSTFSESLHDELFHEVGFDLFTDFHLLFLKMKLWFFLFFFRFYLEFAL